MLLDFFFLTKSCRPTWCLLTGFGAIFLFQHTEALLYGFQSIAETIDVNYSDVIPGLIGLIPRININNVQLADTVMFTIGVCSYIIKNTHFYVLGNCHLSSQAVWAVFMRCSPGQTITHNYFPMQIPSFVCQPDIYPLRLSL